MSHRVIVAFGQQSSSTVTPVAPPPPPPPAAPTASFGTLTRDQIQQIYREWGTGTNSNEDARAVVASYLPTNRNGATVPALTFPRLELSLSDGTTFIIPEMVFIGYNFGTAERPSTERVLIESSYRAIVAALQSDPSYASTRAMQAYAASASRNETIYSLGTNHTLSGTGNISAGGITFVNPSNPSSPNLDNQVETIVTTNGLNLNTTSGQIEFVARLFHEGILHATFRHSFSAYDENRSLIDNINWNPTVEEIIALDLAYGGSEEMLDRAATFLAQQPGIQFTAEEMRARVREIIRTGTGDVDGLVASFIEVQFPGLRAGLVAREIDTILRTGMYRGAPVDRALLEALDRENFIDLKRPPEGQVADEAYRSNYENYEADGRLIRWRREGLEAHIAPLGDGSTLAYGTSYDLFDAAQDAFIGLVEYFERSIEAGIENLPLLLKIDLSALLGTVGSSLARYYADGDPFKEVLFGAAGSSLLSNLGELIEGRGQQLPGVPSSFREQISSDFFENLKAQGVGAISSYLTAEFVAAFGADGDGGAFVSSTSAAGINQIVSNLTGSQVWADQAGNIIRVNGSGAIVTDGTGSVVSVDQPPPAGVEGAQGVDRPWNLDLGVAVATAAASFLGGKLADSIVEFDTVGGQIGAAIGQAYGAFNAGAYLMAAGVNPVTFVIAVIAIAVWKIIGGLIGSLFGGTPKAGADVVWNANDQRFEVGRVWSKNGGSKDAVRGMAGSVSELLNGVTSVSGARISDPWGVQVGAYEMKGKRYIYKPNVLGGQTFSSKDYQSIVLHGAFIALADLSERLVGGDVYIKRALSATLEQSGGNPSYAAPQAGGLNLPPSLSSSQPRDLTIGNFEVEALFGNVATAQDYANYLHNSTVIDALMVAAPDSAAAAGWAITFARVVELGLDRRWKSDWLGGWAAFLDESPDEVTCPVSSDHA